MRSWECSRCDTTTQTAATQPGTPMHPCGGLGGMTVPFAAAGQRSDARLVERQDYVGGEDVPVDDGGRVWMAAVVTTDTTEHVAVYAPTAYASARQ